MSRYDYSGWSRDGPIAAMDTHGCGNFGRKIWGIKGGRTGWVSIPKEFLAVWIQQLCYIKIISRFTCLAGSIPVKNWVIHTLILPAHTQSNRVLPALIVHRFDCIELDELTFCKSKPPPIKFLRQRDGIKTPFWKVLRGQAIWSVWAQEKMNRSKIFLDQIGRFMKVLGNKLSYKSCPNIRWKFGLF